MNAKPHAAVGSIFLCSSTNLSRADTCWCFQVTTAQKVLEHTGRPLVFVSIAGIATDMVVDDGTGAAPSSLDKSEAQNSTCQTLCPRASRSMGRKGRLIPCSHRKKKTLRSLITSRLRRRFLPGHTRALHSQHPSSNTLSSILRARREVIIKKFHHQ